MVTVEYLRTLYAYQSWANGRILAAAEGLSAEELLQAPIPAHACIRDVCVHIFSAEWIWRNRIMGISPRAMLAPADFPTLDAICERWEQETTALQALVLDLAPGDQDRLITYARTDQQKTFTSPLWQILVHVANHNTQHRSELAAMLTILGRSPGDLDMIGFFRAIG